MNIKRYQLEALCTFIIRDLKCACNCTYETSLNEPCACGFTNIEEIFRDEFEIDFKEYPDAIKRFYEENYGTSSE